MPPEPPIPTPIYRLVHIESLSVCLERGGMHAPNHTPADGRPYRTIHREDIQAGRRVRNVPKGPRGTVHDYVPFYFGPRSVMLYQLHTGWVPGYSEGQEPLIYLVSTCQAVAAEGLGVVFSDGHGLASFTGWYDDPADLGKVDWGAAYARQWNDTLEDPDRQRRKQAEFLVHRICPWSVLTEIGVYNEPARDRVEATLRAHGREVLPVRIRSEWYYS
jgi:ssDNA thymidine ADP-ribosyltransferase, DarT